MTGLIKVHKTTDGAAQDHHPALVGWWTVLVALFILAQILATGVTAESVEVMDEAAAFNAAKPLFARRCAFSGCHVGMNAPKGLRLEADRIYRSTVNVPARSDGRYALVAPGDPASSLLYLKLLEPKEGQYHGPRMPLDLSKFEEHELATIRRWIESFPEDRWSRVREEEKPSMTSRRTFLDSYLLNLPGTDALGRRTFEVRIAHRFKAAIDAAGSEELYGLDSGAWVSLGLAYGLSPSWELGLRHTNFQKADEIWVKYSVLKQQADETLLSLAVRGSYSHLRETGRANRDRYTGQILLSRRWGEHVSILLAPTYVTRANYLNEDDDDGTLALGFGAEVRLTRNFALVGEWVGQLSGVKDRYESVSLGVRRSTGLHGFDLFVTNTSAAHTDLYAPGGDLDAGSADLRLGFNISRKSRPPGLHGP